ncbi:MAG: hypothetical protein WKF86_09685 [Acidimicrobiales bacterium]
MSAPPPPLRTVMCGDDAEMHRCVPRLLRACGFELVATVPLGLGLVDVVRRARPDVVALDIGAAGIEGLGIIGRLVAAAEGCAVVVRTPFAALEADALEAGAAEVVSADDLRPLLQVLQQIRAAAHAGTGCPCCSAADPPPVPAPPRPAAVPPQARARTGSTYGPSSAGGPAQAGTSSSSTNPPES